MDGRRALLQSNSRHCESCRKAPTPRAPLPMPTAKPKLQLVVSISVLFLLALGVGCRGFFVNPTLTSVTVSPATPSIEQSKTVQMTATGTFDDGSTKALTTSVQWSTSDATIAQVSTSGLVTASSAATGTTTLTATSGTISGSTSVTVVLAGIVSIAVSPTNPSITVGGNQQFSALATVQGGGTQDITTSVTWTSSNTSVATIDSSGNATALAAGTTQITATS